MYFFYGGGDVPRGIKTEIETEPICGGKGLIGCKAPPTPVYAPEPTCGVVHLAGAPIPLCTLLNLPVVGCGPFGWTPHPLVCAPEPTFGGVGSIRLEPPSPCVRC